MKLLTVGESFAGIGGIGLGFEKAGFKTLWSVDLLNEFTNPYKLPHADVLIAGFLYQPFFEDKHGFIFFETVNIAAAVNPLVILLEFSKDLLTHNKGKTFERIEKVLNGAGYTVRFKVINGSKHSNISINKERLYIFCFKDKEAARRFKYPILYKQEGNNITETVIESIATQIKKVLVS